MAPIANSAVSRVLGPSGGACGNESGSVGVGTRAIAALGKARAELGDGLPGKAAWHVWPAMTTEPAASVRPRR